MFEKTDLYALQIDAAEIREEFVFGAAVCV